MNVLTAELCILDSSEEEEDSDASISESEISQMRRETITTPNQTAEGTNDLADVTNIFNSIENIVFDDYPDFVQNIADDRPDLIQNIIVIDTNNPNLVVNIAADSNPDLVENVANDDADRIESIVDSNPDLVADDTSELKSRILSPQLQLRANEGDLVLEEVRIRIIFNPDKVDRQYLCQLPIILQLLSMLHANEADLALKFNRQLQIQHQLPRNWQWHL